MTDRAVVPERIGAPGRAADLDLFKTVLVWGMITAHCIQLLAFRSRPPALDVISDVVNLLTFSGFMFAFGLGVGLSTRSGRTWWARLRPVVLLALATYVSEFAFELLVDKQQITPALAWNILTFSRLYGWSEFLASFAVLYLIIAIARPVLVSIGSNWLLTVAVSIACFVATGIVVSLDLPLLATLVGTTNFASFPLLAYLPWFLVGIAYARHPDRPGAPDWVLAAVATTVCTLYVLYYGSYPGRFPPTVLFVVGPALILLVYLVVARLIARAVTIPAFILGTGRHVLASLLLSNLTIFGLRYLYGLRLGRWWWIVILAIAIIAFVTAWAAVLDWNVRRRRNPAGRPVRA